MILLLLGLTPGLVSAAVEDYVGKPIGRIRFEPAQQPYTPEELAGILPLKANEPLRLSLVRETIKRLFATGRYSDIVIEATLDNGLVILTLVTKGTWFVGRVSVDSLSPPPSLDQLVNATGLNPGYPFYPGELANAESNLKQTLGRNGFFQPDIAPQVGHETSTEQANIHFVIATGRRARLGPPILKGDLQRPAAQIVKQTHWKGWFGWHRITETRVQNGLDRVLRYYHNRDYLMARVTLDSIDPKTGRPTLDVNAGRIVRIEATGTRVSRSRLRTLIPVFEERSVDNDLLVEGARNLTGYFQTEGYFDAKVSFSSSTPADGGLLIRYAIDRGERHKLVLLDVQGNHYFDLKTIRERMLVAPASTQLRRGRYSASLLQHDLSAITDLYRSNGFRDARVTSEVQDNYRGKTGDVAVFLHIEEGDQWFVASVQFVGVSPQYEQTFRDMLQSGPGQPFSEASVATDRDNILSYYFNRGYTAASFEWSYKPSPTPHRVDLQFMITEGEQHFVREVLVSGLRTTRPQFVDSRIDIQPGDPLSQAKMLDTERRLYDTGIFAKVDVAVQNPNGEERDKYVLLQLEEARKYALSFGFGAELARIGGSQTSLESPAGQTGFSPDASLNVSRLNLFGRAHSVSLGGRVSSLQQRALLNYTAPQIHGWRNLDLSFSALFDSSRDVRTFSARRWEGSTQLAQHWTRARSLFYRFSYRRVSVNQATLKIQPELIPLLSQPVRVGSLSASFLEDRRDNPVDTHRGIYNSLDLGVASKIFGSETSFFRLLGRNSTYYPIGRRLVLARNTSFGLMRTLQTSAGLPPSPQDIPLPERFFAGGATTHRGFPENQAGPRDPVTGFPIGGKALLLFNTELRFPLYGQNIGGVLFHDAGNVYTSLSDVSFRMIQRNITDFNYMVHAFGLGLRYQTPIGPVRADVAFSPNSPRFHGCQGTLQQLLFGACVETNQRINQFQFHFSLGQTF